MEHVLHHLAIHLGKHPEEIANPVFWGVAAGAGIIYLISENSKK